MKGVGGALNDFAGVVPVHERAGLAVAILDHAPVDLPCLASRRYQVADILVRAQAVGDISPRYQLIIQLSEGQSEA